MKALNIYINYSQTLIIDENGISGYDKNFKPSPFVLAKGRKPDYNDCIIIQDTQYFNDNIYSYQFKEEHIDCKINTLSIGGCGKYHIKLPFSNGGHINILNKSIVHLYGDNSNISLSVEIAGGYLVGSGDKIENLVCKTYNGYITGFNIKSKLTINAKQKSIISLQTSKECQQFITLDLSSSININDHKIYNPNASFWSNL